MQKKLIWTCDECGRRGEYVPDAIFQSSDVHAGMHVTSVFDPVPTMTISEVQQP